MLRLNHANLPVADVGALRDFFVRHFGFRTLSTRGPDAFVVLEGEDGFILNLMRNTPSEGSGFPANFHVGFLVETPSTVHAKHSELAGAGVDVGAVEELTRGGYSSVTFYCHAPNGILVEVGSPAAS